MKSPFTDSSLRSGQSLLIIVLLISVIFTLITTASYRLTTETQNTTNQTDSIRALAAADAGIEKGLDRLNNVGLGVTSFSFYSAGITNLQAIDTARSKITIRNTRGTSFTSPITRQNEQYSFYLSEFNPQNSTFINPVTSNITVFYASGSAGNCNGVRPPAIEYTIIYGDMGDQLERKVSEPCTVGNRVTGDATGLAAAVYSPFTINGTTYYYQFSLVNFPTSYPRVKMVILRPLYADTSFGFYSLGQMPNQGVTITSEAYSSSGVSKVVTLFQPYPQIPADLFITSF